MDKNNAIDALRAHADTPEQISWERLHTLETAVINAMQSLNAMIELVPLPKPPVAARPVKGIVDQVVAPEPVVLTPNDTDDLAKLREAIAGSYTSAPQHSENPLFNNEAA